jgi:DNA-binding Lrp family transcriptional regulator
MKLFIMVQSEAGREKEVIEKLKDYKKEGIENIYIVTGPYDLVVEARVPDEKELNKLVTSIRKRVDGIYSTYTLICRE